MKMVVTKISNVLKKFLLERGLLDDEITASTCDSALCGNFQKNDETTQAGPWLFKPDRKTPAVCTCVCVIGPIWYKGGLCPTY